MGKNNKDIKTEDVNKTEKKQNENNKNEKEYKIM